jgi:hypothetical protein
LSRVIVCAALTPQTASNSRMPVRNFLVKEISPWVGRW